MDWFFELLGNRFLLAGLSGWFIAQVMKVIINAWIHRKLIWERMVGDGGMPSGHSATVTSLAAYTALCCGFGSFQFAIAAIFAIVVCHDAMGVRQETGKQAVVLNEMIKTMELFDAERIEDITLKELVGHTPIQVAAGIVIGVCNALILHFFVF